MNSQMNQSSYSHNTTHNHHLNQRSKYVISYPAYHKKEKGILELNQVSKELSWRPDDPNSHSQNVLIKCENIAQTKKDSKEERELLFIKQKNDLINVFAFKGTNNVQNREQLFDMLNMSPAQFYEHEFKSLSLTEKKRVLLLIEDDYLKLLFDEITSKREIIPLEDFWAFVKKMYPEKMSFSLMEQPIQPCRSDELSLIGIPKYPISFDWAVKSRLLASYDDVRKLFEYHIKLNQKEEFFWREFIKNQDKNITEVVGGLTNVYFTCEEEKIIKQSNSTTTNSKHPNHKSSSKNRIKSSKARYDKRYEPIEKHMNYYDNYESECITIPEYDLNESKLSMEEEYNRKDIANIISSRNDYSSRKLEKLDYIPNQKVHEITYSFPNIATISKNKKSKAVIIQYPPKKKYNNVMKQFASMEMEQQSESLSSFGKTFKRINTSLEETAKKKITLDIPPKEYQKTISIINHGNLLRDLWYIYEVSKQNNFHIKDNILSLTKEIKKKAIESMQLNLNPCQMNQLEIILSFYNNHFSS